jgi:hypothetical protein
VVVALVLFGFVCMAVVGLLFRSFLGALASSESVVGCAVGANREFRCGVRAHVPQLAYTSYPMGRLIVSRQVLGLRLPMGDYKLPRASVESLVSRRSFSGLFQLLHIDAAGKSAKVSVWRSEWPTVEGALEEHSWLIAQ